MDLTPYVTALRDDLANAASVGDEQTARAGTALAGALEPAVRLALMNALSDLAAEISEKVDGHNVSLRLRGREVDVAVDKTDGPPSEESAGGFFAGPASSPFAGPGGPFRRPGAGAGFGAGADMGDISRMTLRLVDQIKGQAEQAAAAQGMSLNSWISQAVQGALKGDSWGGSSRGHGGGPGRRRWEGSWGDGRWEDTPSPGTPSPGTPGDAAPDAPTPPPAPTPPAPGTAETPPSSGPGPDDQGGSGVSGWVRG
ncbi:toxin-antitoxin system HicB family antitoxin [Actinomycetospora atypica]|uniref:Toxin-antitoxin system HicB family antitoxin n=1 Tax=Actinomycetospora atypica TaxID=1290095 RepID=A0ABV9YNN6_9PSEU